MTNYKYQYGFSEIYSDWMYNIEWLEQKSKKMLSVLNDYYSGKLEKLSLLNIGCSTGVSSNMLSRGFDKVVGIDIDKPAIKYAQEHYHSDNLKFFIQDAMNIGFADNSFNVIICAHVYDHVPDSNRLMSEIHRVLKSGGVCYFVAVNRLNLIDAHYKLPFLSVIPKPLAHLYLRVLKRGDFYYENKLTLWGLQALVSRFEVIDYTLKIINNSQRYYTTDVVKPGSFKQKIIMCVLRRAYWLCPMYIWLLRKKKMTEQAKAT